MAIKQKPEKEVKEPATLQVVEADGKVESAAPEKSLDGELGLTGSDTSIITIGGDDGLTGDGEVSLDAGLEGTSAEELDNASALTSAAEATTVSDPAPLAEALVLSLSKLSTYIVHGLVFKSGIYYTLESSLAARIQDSLLKETSPTGELVFNIVDEDVTDVVVVSEAKSGDEEGTVQPTSTTEADITITHTEPKRKVLKLGRKGVEPDMADEIEQEDSGTITV